MTIKDLETLYDYGYWANRLLFDAMAPLTTDQFVQPVVGGHASIRNTLVHTMSAEWGWLDRCGGPPRGPALKPDDYPTLASVVDRWREVELRVREFLAGLRDVDLDRTVEFSFGTGPKQAMRLGHLMHHAANHGVHHRGQVAMMIRSLGLAPGTIDLLLYYPQV